MREASCRPLILALAVAMAPLVFRLPGWTVAWCMGWWGYRLMVRHRRWPAPSPGVRRTAFVVGMAAVLAAAGLRFDGADFIILLAIMAGIKPLEIKGRRDRMVTVFLAYFLVITSLFVFENLSMTLYLFVSVWVITGVLIHVNHPDGAMGGQLRLSARLVALAVPLTVLLFLLFPRLPGSFWGSPWSRQGRSGFSSIMRMDDVSRLALVDAPAFSVSFDGGPPDPAQRYWRGIVFQRFDGRSWYPGRREQPRRAAVQGRAHSSYQVMLEPHAQRHLFALDLPASADPVATILADNTLVARRPVRQRLHYRADSILDGGQTADVPPGRIFLQLPEERNPRAQALGKSWARQHPAPDAVVDAALAMFREGEFTYTLRPDRLGSHAVDDFLFTSRKGFCEHFASAFAVLMRSAGLPTRLVGGYQGGRWNAMGGFLSVRQSDAHVWCEVWMAGKGWVRIDPTFAVSPDRIDLGIEAAMAGDGLPGFLTPGGENLLARSRRAVEEAWDALNIRWNLWFMGFSAEGQLELLRRLGLTLGYRWRWLPAMLLPPLFIAIVVMLTPWRKRRSVRRGTDPALQLYARFLAKMKRAGLPKAAHQGPLDYARQIARRDPALGAAVEGITENYIALRYAGGRSAVTLRLLRRQVRKLRPGRPVGPGNGVAAEPGEPSAHTEAPRCG